MTTARDQAIEAVKRTLLDSFSGAFSARLPEAIVDLVGALLPPEDRAAADIERLEEQVRMLRRVEREGGSRVSFSETGALIIDGPWTVQTHGLSDDTLQVNRPRRMDVHEGRRVLEIALAGGTITEAERDAEIYAAGHEAGTQEALLDVAELLASQRCPHCSEMGPRSGWGLILGDDEDTMILVCREAYVEVHG